MNKYKANKIIVEFMGNKNPIPVNVEQLSKKQQRVYLPYLYSIDELIPVWEAIYDASYYNLTITSDTMSAWLFYWDYFSTQKIIYESYLNQPLAEAACIATAMAIKEISR